MALHLEGHFGGGSDYYNKDAPRGVRLAKIDSGSSSGGCLTLRGILENIGPTCEEVRRNITQPKKGLAGQQKSVRIWIDEKLKRDCDEVRRLNARNAKRNASWKGVGNVPPPLPTREPVQDEQVLALAQSLSSYLPCCDPGHGRAFSLSARAAPGDPHGILDREGEYWKAWDLGGSTAEVVNNRSTVRILQRYRNAVERYFYRTTGYPTLHCPAPQHGDQFDPREEIDPNEVLDLVRYDHGVLTLRREGQQWEFGVTDFGKPVHIWGHGLLFNSAIHPSSARRLTRSSDAEYWAENYQVDREGHHLADIDTAFTDVWNYETPVKHYVERVNTVDLNPDLSSPEFHGGRHTYTPDPENPDNATPERFHKRTYHLPPGTPYEVELEWNNPHISSGPAVEQEQENYQTKHCISGFGDTGYGALYKQVVSEFGIGFGSRTAGGVDWDAAERQEHPVRDVGIKWTKLDKDCPGGAHILAPPHYINADKEEFERFAHLTETGVDRFNQERLDLDNQVNYCGPPGVRYPAYIAPGWFAGRQITDARVRAIKLIQDGWSIASAKRNLYCTRAEGLWDPDTEDNTTFPVQVTAHTFQLALEILKVEALEIRAGRTAREAIEIADLLLLRPNRLAAVTDTASASSVGTVGPRLDTLSHQFFTQDRTKKYPPILRAQSGGPAVEPKYQKAREENYKRRARGEPELPYWTHKDISRATECVFWTSHSVLFKFNLDEEGYELDSLDYGPCEYETRRGTVVEYDLEPGVTLPNLFSDGYNRSDFWYPSEESYDPDEELIRVFKAGGNSCDEDLDGWYEPKVIIDVRIPTRVCSVDLHRYAIAADQLVNQAELADELVVNYQRRLAHAEKEVRIYKDIARRHLEYGLKHRGDLEDLRKTHADTVVKKASLHRLCRDLSPRSFREVKEVTLGFIRWGVTLLLNNRSLARSNKQNCDRIEELEDQLAALGIQGSEERNSKKQRTNLLGISDGHRWTEATTKDLKAIAGVKPEERLAALENLQNTVDCQEELLRQFTVRQKEYPELPEQFK